MIRRALGTLAHKMWTNDSVDELTRGFAALLSSREAAVFIDEENDAAIGFAQVQLRHDYVEDTKTSPVGYLEGILVLPQYRHSGRAAALCQRCEAWAKEMGCTEFASDCEQTNTDSLMFHQKLGFSVANRIICFTKKL